MGFTTPLDFCATQLPPATEAFRTAMALGRVLWVVLRVGRRCAVLAYAIYGYAGAHNTPEKAEATATRQIPRVLAIGLEAELQPLAHKV